MDFIIMGYGYFLIRFHVPNVSNCNSNECLSVRIFGTVCELAVQTENYRLRTDLIPAISEKRPSKPITILHIIPGIANIGGNGYIAANMSKIAPMTISTIPFINESSLNFDFILEFTQVLS